MIRPGTISQVSVDKLCRSIVTSLVRAVFHTSFFAANGDEHTAGTAPRFTESSGGTGDPD